ncbi:MAG: hypothetical protein WD534_13005 [Phycisphaeraceae bacterium]
MRLSELTTPRDPEERGLRCPRCGCGHLPVVYTRPKPGCILRVRECRHCGKRLSTRERV